MNRPHIEGEGVHVDESDYYEDGHGIDGNIPNHKNNEGRIYHQRHGKKDKRGNLAPSGMVQAIESGLGREPHDVTNIKVSGSEIERTKVTAALAAAGMAEKSEAAGRPVRVGKARTKEGMSFKPFSDAAYAQAVEVEKAGKDSSHWYWKEHREHGFDKDTISGQEMADRTAHDIYGEIKMIGRLNDGSKVALENASHTMPIEMFIAEAFGDEIEKDSVDPEGEDLYMRMGGSFKAAEDYEITAKTDETGRLTAVMQLRGKEYRVNLRKLREMSERHVERERQKRDAVVETPA